MPKELMSNNGFPSPLAAFSAFSPAVRELEDSEANVKLSSSPIGATKFNRSAPLFHPSKSLDDEWTPFSNYQLSEQEAKMVGLFDSQSLESAMATFVDQFLSSQLQGPLDSYATQTHSSAPIAAAFADGFSERLSSPTLPQRSVSLDTFGDVLTHVP
jgi:hypothetical protein